MAEIWLDEAPPHLHSNALADYLAARRELYDLLCTTAEKQTARDIIRFTENRARGRSFPGPEDIHRFVNERTQHHRLDQKEHDLLLRMMLAYGGGQDTRGTPQHQAQKRAKHLDDFHKSQLKTLVAICTICLGIAVLFFLAEYNAIGWGFLIFSLAMGIYGIIRYIAIGSVQVLQAASAGAPAEAHVQDTPPPEDDREVYIHTIQTPKGHVILTWSANRPDIRAALQHSPEAAARPILAKLTEILTAKPDADLKKYEKAIGISIIEVERPWEATPDPLAQAFANLLGRAKTLVELRGMRQQFFIDNNIDPESELGQDIENVFIDFEQRFKAAG